MNTKTKRLLDTLAIVLKDERLALIQAVHDIIADERDGYPYDFKGAVETMRCFCQGMSIREDETK